MPDPAIAARRRAGHGARRENEPRHLEFVRVRRPERLAGDGRSSRPDRRVRRRPYGGDRQRDADPRPGDFMRALQLIGDRKLELCDVPVRRRRRPLAKCKSASRRSGINHIDVWGCRGMAFAKRKLPLIVGVEAVGRNRRRRRRRVNLQTRRHGRRRMARMTCGHCKAAARAATISAKTSAASWDFMSTASRAT